MIETPLWLNGAYGSEHWLQLEKESWTPSGPTDRFRFIRNLTQPVLTVLLPDPAIKIYRCKNR
jgi:hypothetical protein